MRTTLNAALLALVALLLLVTVPVTSPAGALGATPGPVVAVDLDVSAANDFVARINGLRISQGLAPLAVHGDLVAGATDWAYHLSDIDSLEHDGNLAGDVGVAWSKLGENVGAGSAIGPVWDAFVNSPGHYANLVDPQYTHIGVAVVVDGGRLYTVHRFMTLSSSPVVTAPPPPSAPPATTTAPAPAAAQKVPGSTNPSSTSPSTTGPSTTSTTAPASTTTTAELVAVPAAPDRAAAVLDALHEFTS